MSTPIWRRIGALRRVLTPEPSPEGMSEDEEFEWQVKKHGLRHLLGQPDNEEQAATPVIDSAEPPPEMAMERASATRVEPPPQVEATSPPSAPRAPASWWEERLLYRPRRGPYAHDVPDEPEREPWEDDDDFTP